jgi:HPt (histidine-containing phosphotransfer) domain-containing protein
MLNAILNYVRESAAEAKAMQSKDTHNAPSQATIIISEYVDDPDIGAILDEFIGGLAEQIDEMRRAMADADFLVLQRGAHRMKGAGGGYGYPMLSDAARTLEDAAKTRDAQSAFAELERVASLCDAIQRGRDATAKPN